MTGPILQVINSQGPPWNAFIPALVCAAALTGTVLAAQRPLKQRPLCLHGKRSAAMLGCSTHDDMQLAAWTPRQSQVKVMRICD